MPIFSGIKNPLDYPPLSGGFVMKREFAWLANALIVALNTKKIRSDGKVNSSDQIPSTGIYLCKEDGGI